ncbi:MAG TPA: helix-turn-helix domain-containing protein [Candidatus Binatia bacterium]|nr:helix-turn-helix domain-containing protein [Candidatus Binatia bacterium]
MKTLTLPEAASFLKMHPEEVRRRARMGVVPGAKAGRRWVFIEDDLVSYLRSFYAASRQALVGDRSELCQSTNAEVRGGFVSPRQAASLLDALLKQRTSKARGNSTTS